MDLRAIREAVAERLQAVPGVWAYAWPADHVATSGAAIGVTVSNGEEAYVDYAESFGPSRTEQVYLTVTVYVPYVDPRSAWNTLDELLSTGTATSRSLVDALMYEASPPDRTLGGVCQHIKVDGVTNLGFRDSEQGARYLTADLPVHIIAKRNV